jgi:NAD(P)-dependent dehydrogenase (short-subunit alcohol dehydrogenase family)
MESTKKKLAIVTGAARGIGLATAKLFNQNDYKVAIVDRDKNELSNLSLANNLMKSFCYDISDFNNVDMMYQEILEWHDRVDILVNNAGVADFGSIEMTDFNRWNEVMKTNLDGAFMCSQKAISYLKKTKGSIINIASISGLRASTLRVAYGTSKAAIIQLTKQQAAELGEYGIRVNCVAPGPVKTKLAMAVHTQDIIDAYHDAIPLNRYGTENEIANTIYFLASEKASYITGQILAVDGGFEATGVGLSSLRN